MRKSLLLIVICSVIFYNSSRAVNQINIYVPESSTLNEQTMMVGVPSTINIELTCEDTLFIFQIPIEISSQSGDRLFDPLINDDYHYMLPSEYLTVHGITNNSGGNFPDSFQVWGLHYSNEEDFLPPGNYLLAQISITPTNPGILNLTDYHHMGDSLLFIPKGGTTIVPSLVSPSILVLENDCNGNGISDDLDITADPDLDCNNNSIIDSCETASGYTQDCNFNYIPDECDLLFGNTQDCNSNGILDICEMDCNDNGIADECETMSDCNCNNVDDLEEIALGKKEDLDMNNIPDECDNFDDNLVYLYVPKTKYHDEQTLIKNNPEKIRILIRTDGNLRGVKIINEVSTDDSNPLWGTITTPDIEYRLINNPFNNILDNLRQNGTWPDSLFLYAFSTFDSLLPGTYNFIDVNVIPTDSGMLYLRNIEEYWTDPDSTLFQFQGYSINPQYYAPDISIIELPDCNDNGVPDTIEVTEGLAEDCNGNFIPDECDIATGYSFDCNNNGIPDECDISIGYSEDCNNNNVPDECDPDCNFNEIPDDCELITDCNCNKIDDSEDILSGWAQDINLNNIPDDCEGLVTNNIVVHVPQEDGHLSQELILNEPEYLYFHFINNTSVIGISIPLLLSSLNDSTLFDEITEEDVEFLLPDEILNVKVFGTEYHDYIWPDTFNIAFIKTSGYSLSPGSKPIMRIKVTPVKAGTVEVDWVLIEEYNIFASYTDESQNIIPMDFNAADINIVGNCCIGVRGNFDDDPNEEITITDLLMMVDYMFLNPPGPGPACLKEGDFDGSGQIDISDLLAMIDYMFVSPPAQYPVTCE